MARVNATKELWLDELRVDGRAFQAVVANADPDADVPSCPGWAVAELVHHLGSVYRWVQLHVVRGVITPPERRLEQFTEEPPAADQLSWFDEQFSELLDTLERLDEDLPAWNWAPAPRRASFWQRRMAHETTLHRWDAQTAIGRVEPIPTRLATDGIAEVLDTWLPAGRRDQDREYAGLVALEAVDAEHTWLIRLRAEGIALLDTETIFDDDEHRPVVIAEGPASDIFLALWGRVGFDVLEVTGDEDELAALRVAKRRRGNGVA